MFEQGGEAAGDGRRIGQHNRGPSSIADGLGPLRRRGQQAEGGLTAHLRQGNRPGRFQGAKSLFLARSPFYGVAQMLMSLHKKPAAVAEVAQSHSQGIVGAVGPAPLGGL